MNSIQTLTQKLDNIPTPKWFWVTFGIATLERLVLWLFYPVTPLSDTGSYRRSAEAILGGWNAYDGTRTPGYPAFMAIIGSNDHLYIAQLLLGLATTLFFFYAAYKLSKRGWFAALVALAHSLSLQQLLFEPNLMTETLTTFWLALAWAGMAFLLLDQAKGESGSALKAGAALLTGLAVAFGLITRPLFIYLPFWFALILLIGWNRPLKEGWVPAVLVFLPGLLMIGAWVNFIHSHFGVWSLSAMTGYHMVQHTGAFFEYLPDDNAAIRDTYIKYRDQKIARTGSPTNAIWEAIPELQQVSGDSFYGLAGTMQRLSTNLIVEHPFLFLKSVTEGWVWFWKAPVYWRVENVPNPAVLAALRALILLQRGLLVAMNLVFIAGSVLAVAWRKPREKMGMNVYVWLNLGVIWAGSVMQTLLDHGDNPRFLVPLQSLVVMVVLWWILNWLTMAEKGAQ